MHARACALVTLALIPLAGTVRAELSANIGWQSQYIFRGIPQSTSSAQGGLDFEAGGLYLGTWAADVEMGAEVDLYGGYGWEIGNFNLGVGATGYFYTDDFDDTYTELNLSGGYEFLSVGYNTGRYDNFGGPRMDYSFTSLGFEYGGVYGVLGMFGRDFEGDYYELGYQREVSGIDLSFGWVYSDDDLVSDGDNSNVYFGVHKTFGLAGD